ncbi:MAG: choice-of-anchor D domain-containing protein, partial [Acidobacteriaceae bacterium]
MLRWGAALAAITGICLPIALSGCGSIVATPNVAAASAGTLVVSSTSVAFGNVTVGKTGSSSVTLTNSGTASVAISAITVSGQSFSISGMGSLPITVAPQDTVTISLAFAPGAAGAATGSLQYTSNASTGGSGTVSLSGTGVAQGASTPPVTTSASPASMVSPTPGTTLGGSSVTFTWNAGSGVSAYQLWLGTTGTGSADVGTYSAASTTASTVSMNVTGVPTSGATMYVRLLSEINGSWQSTDYTYKEKSATQPTQPTEEAVQSLSCSNATLTGAGTDPCTVTLSGAAGTGGETVTLAST